MSRKPFSRGEWWGHDKGGIPSRYEGPGDGAYSCSTVKQGEIEALSVANGVHTFIDKVLIAIVSFCIYSISVRMVVEIIVIYPIQHCTYSPAMGKLLVLISGGIPVAMPTVLAITTTISFHRLSQEVFAKGFDPDTVVLMIVGSSQLENQDALDAA
ncbi:ATPase 11, plasma membrane-type-like [Andrographis paniculata]|uniref:ATPase 11, plasma membrane-type-like n=1 Tax=Andrographis paniculata TaxID=175694 RepID=UPI0021E8BC57|nr:ATPase 11, plasma membrane-type-like [Andrographis paniculata]